METFKQLFIHAENLTDSFYKEYFISGRKKEILEQVNVWNFTWLEVTQRALEEEMMINTHIKKNILHSPHSSSPR